MTDQLTSTGLTIDDLTTRTAALKAAIRAAISANLDLQTSKPAGQFVEAFAEHSQELAELLEEVYAAFDPDQATGVALTALSLLTGTQRRDATYSTVAVTLDLDATTTVPAGTTFAVSGDTSNTWTLDAAVTSVGASTYPGTATATTAGAVQALAGTLTVIVTPVAGLNSVTNVADATVGQEEETDTELRLRREQEITLGGSASVESIQAALSAVDEVIAVVVLENDADAASDGMPPHSVEALFWDGGSAASTAELAGIILDQKSAGIRAYGSTTETVEDSQGVSHEIGLTRAAEQVIEVEVDVDVDADYVGDTAVEEAIASWSQSALSIGDDVYLSKVSGVVVDLDGVVNVSAVRLAISPAAPAASDVSIGDRQIATISTSDITVTS